MESEGSSQHSEQPATYPYPQREQSSPCPHHTPRKSTLILSSHLGLGFPSGIAFINTKK